MKIDKNSLKTQIYHDLKEQIVFSDLLPGSVITEEEICNKFQVSRTPVREVLLELEKEGFVIIEPRRSTKVPKISIQEMKDIIEARLLIEVYVIRSQSEPLSEEFIARLNDIKRRFSELNHDTPDRLKHFLRLDFELHSTLVLLSKNALLIRSCTEFLQKAVRQWYLMCVHVERRIAESMSEHNQIIDAMIDGDFEGASIILEDHIKIYYEMICFY